ncbi:MAG: hypothetical protein WBA48_17900 [Xanthobacteraceae bacterium]
MAAIVILQQTLRQRGSHVLLIHRLSSWSAAATKGLAHIVDTTFVPGSVTRLRSLTSDHWSMKIPVMPQTTINSYACVVHRKHRQRERGGTENGHNALDDPPAAAKSPGFCCRHEMLNTFDVLFSKSETISPAGMSGLIRAKERRDDVCPSIGMAMEGIDGDRRVAGADDRCAGRAREHHGETPRRQNVHIQEHWIQERGVQDPRSQEAGVQGHGDEVAR